MKTDDRQNLFDFDVLESPIPAPVAPRQQAQPMSYRDALVEQIVRDVKVLEEDVLYWVPSEEFYIDRIIAYRAELDKLDKENQR